MASVVASDEKDNTLRELVPVVAIVDYRVGNLFSVKQACEYAGLQATITSSRQEILSADAVILPGVGAFGDAMETLKRLDLVGVLQDIAASNTPLIGICLGMQLLASESYEFGRHKGLGIIQGRVVRFDNPVEGHRRLKIPQVGWNRIYKAHSVSRWEGTLLDGLPDREFMYFVHSYILQPEDPAVILSMTQYGQTEFCSSLSYGNIFACQFHPERSGTEGLKIYCNLALLARGALQGKVYDATRNKVRIA
jgi:glutamine amidotransferase